MLKVIGIGSALGAFGYATHYTINFGKYYEESNKKIMD